MQMSKLDLAQSKFDSAEPVGVTCHALPLHDGFFDRVTGSVHFQGKRNNQLIYSVKRSAPAEARPTAKGANTTTILSARGAYELRSSLPRDQAALRLDGIKNR
jgi:hypothetical protein